MLDMKIFGEKLKNHRTRLNLTQQAVAEKIGVSAQAVSKWEAGDCLPDCFNLKELGDVYGVSLDILLETEKSGDIKAVSEKIEQLADEFIWAKQNRDIPNAHRDLGDDLWSMWKGIYFIETGNKEIQEREKENANLRVCSEYGMKIWDDDGVACVIKSSLRDKLQNVGERELDLLRDMCSADGYKLLSLLDSAVAVKKEELVAKSGIEINHLNTLLLKFTESKIIEFVFDSNENDGYKICARYGITAYMMIAAAFILAKPNCTTSEYIVTTT